MSEQELIDKYKQALQQIHWLENEVMRLKLLLEDKDIIKNSLSTPRP